MSEIYHNYMVCPRPHQQRVLPQPEFEQRLTDLLNTAGIPSKRVQVTKENETGKRINNRGYKLCLEDIERIIQPNEDPTFKFE